MRLTKKVFSDLAIFMISFGLFIGIVFPFFVLAMGIPASMILTPWFFFFCITAGIVVGAVNILLARSIVGKRLKLLSERMQFIEEKLNSSMSIAELEECTREQCSIPVDSEDVIGESAQSFNNLVHALSLSIRTESALKEFNEMLSSQLELDILSKNALDSLMQYMHAQAGAILIERQGDLFIGASYNIKDPETLTGNDAVWDSLKTLQRKKLQLDDTIRVEGVLVNFHPRDILIQPIMYKGISLGVIVLASSVLFDEELCSGFEMFSKNLSLALRNAVTYEQLQKLAANDPLTGIYNRRFGMTRLNEEFNRAIRTSSPLGVLIFDIDHFKQVNDTYGHTVGDRVLLSVTQVAKMALRKGDFIIRYGGEEFMIILPGASKEDTVFIAERLRHMVEESSCSHGSQQIKITVSVGATSLPEFSAENESELIQQADEAMYRAKELGRNRVTAV